MRNIIVLMFSLKTTSFKQTKALAKLLGQKIFRCPDNASVLALSGDLGSGKTTFVRGFMTGFGVRRRIASPTFTIVKNYKNIYHIDCYRLKKPKELLDLGIKEIFKNPQNIVLIEWPEIIKKYLPKNAVWIKFKYGKKENERIIIINDCQ